MSKKATLFNLRQLLSILPGFLPGKNEEHRRRSLGTALENEDIETLKMVEQALALPGYRAFAEWQAHSLGKLKGVFTREEATALATCLSAGAAAWQVDVMKLQPTKFVAYLQEREAATAHFKKAGVGFVRLLEKLGAVDAAQHYFLLHLMTTNLPETFVDFFCHEAEKAWQAVIEVQGLRPGMKFDLVAHIGTVPLSDGIEMTIAKAPDWGVEVKIGDNDPRFFADSGAAIEQILILLQAITGGQRVSPIQK